MDDKVVVGKVGSSRFTPRNIVITVGIIIVAAAAGFGLRWLQTRNHHPAPAPQKTSAAQSAQTLALDGRTDIAQKQITDQLAQPNLSAEDKFQLYYQQGTIYQNSGDNPAALASFKKAIAVKQTQEIYESMARVSVDLGDKASAITYYKKAIQLIPSSSPLASSYKESDEQFIRDLGGQP